MHQQMRVLQDGERGKRELKFYQLIESIRSEDPNGAENREADACGISDNTAALVANWVPRSYGIQQVSDATYLMLEDAAAGYQLPCVMDIKIGFQTWYPWANDSSKQKYRLKDASTTQASLGFRVCGVLVHDCKTGSSWRADRHWGKTLTADTVHQAFHKFADNGYLTLKGLTTGSGMLLPQLQQLAKVFQHQKCWHFYSASLLVVYEGAARTAAEARLVLKLIDFAHTFPLEPRNTLSAESALGGVAGPAGVDDNFLSGLNSLINTLQAAAQQVKTPSL
eukprot:GHRR01025632.1.p1 GENE.GHRR01025632.1~~GHRR01025632.1.p1  ORF type:complete len:280 (+),score=86.93 GHRR01025632.1:597-1436(+)